MSEELEKNFRKLKKYFVETGYVPDSEYYKSVENKFKCNDEYPGSFAIVTGSGNLMLPIKNREGALSYSLLKNSLDNAVEMRKYTGDTGYDGVIDKINENLRKLNYKPLFKNSVEVVDKYTNSIL